MSTEALKNLLKYESKLSDDNYDDISELVEKVDIEPEQDVEKLKKAFSLTQKVLAKVFSKNREYDIEIQEFEKEIQRSTIKIQNYEDDLERMSKELAIFRQDASTGDTRELLSDIARLQNQNDQLKNELKDLENKNFQENKEKEKDQIKMDKIEKDLTKYKRDLERSEEENRELARQIQTYRDEKYSRTGDEHGLFREKINQKNKIIGELEDENSRLLEENQSLNKLLDQNRQYLQDSTLEMNKTRDEIRKLRLLQQHNDSQSNEFKKENDILKSQIEILNSKLLSHQDQDDAIMNQVEARIKEFRLIIQNKEEEIRQLNDLNIQMKDMLSRAQIDSDKVKVSALTKAVQERDKQIELLKKQLEEFAREMDKSASVINNLNKTFAENSKMLSKNSQFNANKQAEQKIIFLENMIRESDSRLKESEEHASEKEKELAELSNRMREYESGDYQLQQAVNEIKGLKGQIKIRDRDIENLTKTVNKIDCTLNEILEENEELRAKLGMDPREKIDIEELNNLKAVRAQENRAVMHVLKREIETLEEERNKLKQTIRKLAKQVGTKVNIASIIDEDLLYDNTDSKVKKTEKPEAITIAENAKENNKAAAKDFELLKKRNEQLMQLCLEFENENKLLENGLTEINSQLKNFNSDKKPTKTSKFTKDTTIKCPSLEKLLNELETNRAIKSNMKTYAFLNQILTDGNVANNITLALKGEIDQLHGRNEELRSQLFQLKTELNKSQVAVLRYQDDIDKLNSDVRFMNNGSTAKDIFQPLKLPAGMAPSSQDIISALNEYLIDTLQELEEYKKISSMTEKDLDSLKRKYAVARHQISLIYKEHLDETKQWKIEKDNLASTNKKLHNTIEVDAVKLQEYERLLDTLEKDEVEIHHRIAESSRQMYLVRANEKQLQRKCISLEEIDLNLIKENKKMKVEMIEMEISVQQRLGYLERFKDMANYRIMSLQKQLEESVPIVKLETVNKEYSEIVQKYRQLLDRNEKNDTLTVSLHQTEQLNKKFENEIIFLKRELENEKDKCRTLEDSLEQLKKITNDNYSYSGPDSESANAQLAKRLTAMEMKELNERQKADHAQRMYDEQRNLLRQLENRNLDLESNMTQLNKNYLISIKTEQDLRQELSECVPKSVNDTHKLRIIELEKQENLLRLEVSRLRELTEITLYQTASLEFINNLSKAQFEQFGAIDIQSSNDESNNAGKLHRQIIMLQISEATAVRKLQMCQSKCKKLEAQLIRAEQKYDRDNLDFFNNRKEQISKISYLRSTIQDLRHKYNGSIPLKQQEKFNSSKEKLADLKSELNEKLIKVNDEKNELEDKIAEYESRSKQIEMLKNASVVTSDGTVKFNEKFLDSFKKSENLRMVNLKLERANRRYKDEIKFLEDMNRKHEITIITLEEDNLRLENDYDQKLLIWEHREADLERTIEHLKKQHQMIENLALNFEEISGNMPDQSLPIANQLDQALNIIRSHVKLLAEAKIQTDLSKKQMEDNSSKLRKLENDVNVRDKIITELRLRLPASNDRDSIIKKTIDLTRNSNNNNSELSGETAPVKAAQATIESLQNRLKQKETTIIKYQDMLQLARDEINQLNHQHEIEINTMLEKLNLTRDSNLKKLKDDIKHSLAVSGLNSNTTATRSQLNRLQELEEVTVEQDNTISAMNQKIKQLNIEINTWKSRTELLNQKSASDLAACRQEQAELTDKFNKQLQEDRSQFNEKEHEIDALKAEIENQKEINSKSPSNEIKQLCEKLKNQLAQKEEQHNKLNQALIALRGDMVHLAKTNLTSYSEEKDQEKKMQFIIDKTSAEYQDKLNSIGEELVKVKKELKTKLKSNDELNLELNDLKSQIKQKEQKIKKLIDEIAKLSEDGRSLYVSKTVYGSDNSKATETEYLKRQIRQLEDKLKKQRVAERPYEQTNYKPRSKSPKQTESEPKVIIRTVPIMDERLQSDAMNSLRIEIEQWRTRYNYVLSENSILSRQKSELEAEINKLQNQMDVNAVDILNENKQLRDELSSHRSNKQRTFSPSKTDIRAENKTQINAEFQKFKKENEKLKEKSNKVEELQRTIEILRAEISNKSLDDSQSTSSNSSLRRIGESGKSTVELEKTIALMKNIILKLQHENNSLKANK